MLRLDRFWYIAAASAELGSRPIRREVEGETLVLFRDSAGNARALTDHCAHRGAALSRGRVQRGRIECPYHGWTYDGSGHLCRVPALSAREPLPAVRDRTAFAVTESDGQIWVWIGGGRPSASPYRFAHYGEPGYSSFTMQSRFRAPVEACLENFLDVPHTRFVHPGLFRAGRPRPASVRIRRRGGEVAAEFLDEPALTGLGPRLLFPRGLGMQHTDRFILPAVTRVDYRFAGGQAFVITSQCTQREEHIVDVTTVITWRLPVPGWLACPLLRAYCRRVIRQDVELLDGLGEQIRRFGRSERSTAADLLGRHIRALRSRAAEGGSASGGAGAPCPEDEQDDERVEHAVLMV